MHTVGRQERTNGVAGAAHWLILAILTLVLAGGLALALVVGRAPVISEWIADPGFFRRALVVHVVLSLWGWFMAYAVGLRLLVDGTKKAGSKGAWHHVSARVLAGAGVFAMVVSAGIKGADPLLVNYIPVVDHPVFIGGLAAFFAGVALELCRWPRFRPPAHWSIPAASAIAWRATAPVAIISIVVFAISWWGMPADLPGEVYYEYLFWGAGHTMQVASVLVMLGAWFYLLRDNRGRAPVGTKTSVAIAAALILPLFIAPVLAMAGPTSGIYIGGFTRLMQFGIAGPVLVALVLCVFACRRFGVSKAGRWAFAVSASLTLVGFGVGAMIRGSDTMIPAHYHASLGAITVSLMALSYALLEIPGWTPQRRWWRKFAALQPIAFGGGQLIFVAGFALSGAFGADRKAYGSDQVIDSAGAFIGLATMGIGGLLAVFGGAAFLFLMAVVCKDRFHITRSRKCLKK